MLDTLSEFNADYISILRQLDDIYKIALDGIEQEKVHMRDGTVVVTEKYPELALRVLATKLTLVRDILKVYRENPEDLDLSVTLNIVPLEKLIEDQK